MEQIAHSTALERGPHRPTPAPRSPLTALQSDPDPRVALAHDFRTPLTAIRAFAEILIHHPSMSRELRDEFLSIIVGETNRLAELVSEVVEEGDHIPRMRD